MDDAVIPEHLPDLAQADVLPVQDLNIRKFAHIEYVRTIDKKILRVCRPCGVWPVFYIPVDSLESEYARDVEFINQKLSAKLPGNNTGNADDDKDNDWCNASCFSNNNINGGSKIIE